jgi:glyoxylase-like metal-dependent hydrolase (beta-lactamase superfamily II)
VARATPTHPLGPNVDPVAQVPFLTEFDPRHGQLVQVAPGLQRLVADNPSKFTAWGTGTYLVGGDEVAIIDPGPADDAHVAALLAAVDGRRVTHLLITHTHADHSPAAAALADATGAPTYGFGPHPPGADEQTEEHGDLSFVPDVAVRDGDVLVGDGFEFECLHTPGHLSNHMCFAERTRGWLFTGDHVMGWSTSVISPPAGDVTDYLANLRRLLDRDDAVYYPTHGPPITEPRPYVSALIEHRLERERQIVDQLALGPRTIPQIVEVLYADVRPELHEPAGRSVHAHLLALVAAGRVEPLTDERWALRADG